MSDTTLVFTEDLEDRIRVVVNFAVHGGREATQAEIERLGQTLVEHADPVDVIAQKRYRFDRERAASVYQVRVEAPKGSREAEEEIAAAAEAWARECLGDRAVMRP